jgi:hypothetical protein
MLAFKIAVEAYEKDEDGDGDEGCSKRLSNLTEVT